MTKHEPEPVSDDADVHSTPFELLDRRNVLRAAGMVALAGGGAAALAACAPAQPTSTPSAPTSSAAPSSASPSSAAPSSAAPSSAAPSSAKPSAPASSKAPPPPSGPSVAAADVPVGSGVIMNEPNNYVVTQPTKGTYKAFTAICTHQQCRVSELRDERIICVCHNSQFSIKDGSVLQEPAEEPLKEFGATLSGKRVYVKE